MTKKWDLVQLYEDIAQWNSVVNSNVVNDR